MERVGYVKTGMWRPRCSATALLVCLLFLSCPGRSSEDGQSLDKSLDGIRFGVLAYVDYSSGQEALAGDEQENYNRFSLTRGYFTMKKSLNAWMGMRLTTDVKHETKDPGTKLHGSYVARLKYFYAELKPPDLGPLTSMKSEVGLGHMPWLDFEEHVNPYRCQGTMAIERAHVFNSADLGASIRGYLGGELEDAEKRIGSHHYTGKYGSWHVGVYNGGGYHAVEKNQDKVVEGRVTLRPLPGAVPGLRLSYLGISGKGNKAKGDEIVTPDGKTMVFLEPPGYQVHLCMLSYRHPMVILTAQYFTTRGNASGEWINKQGNALETEGWSAFGNMKVPATGRKANLFARYDWFDQDSEDEWAEHTAYWMLIAGMAFDLYKNNLLLLAYETTEYDEDAGHKGHMPSPENNLGREEKFQAVWQIKF